ncbi:NUDIX hydrolase [Actinoplanes sp. TFC3]|uniref:NUDIX domain-containing protein n=1 Tax=Actinoplanes sp. TFC3 TaxID=1710355 RepID=UPI001F2DF2E0|nr:NUDIX hydrolase [Actinoplanes sp. TFC3]
MLKTEKIPELDYIASVVRVRAAAGVVLRDELGRVLVVHPTYKDVWELPGGTLELDESPAAACDRELEEELGLVVSTGKLLCVDWVPPSPPWDGGLMFLFDGGVLSAAQIGAIRLCAEELDRFEFVEPARLQEVLIERLARRVNAALEASARGGGVYLEDGVAVAKA